MGGWVGGYTVPTCVNGGEVEGVAVDGHRAIDEELFRKDVRLAVGVGQADGGTGKGGDGGGERGRVGG